MSIAHDTPTGAAHLTGESYMTPTPGQRSSSVTPMGPRMTGTPGEFDPQLTQLDDDSGDEDMDIDACHAEYQAARFKKLCCSL